MASTTKVLTDACDGSFSAHLKVRAKITIHAAAMFMGFVLTYSIWKFIVYPFFIATPYLIVIQSFLKF